MPCIEFNGSAREVRLLKLGDIGEFCLIDRLDAILSGRTVQSTPAGTPGGRRPSQAIFGGLPQAALGIGDDCSVVPCEPFALARPDGPDCGAPAVRLVTADMLVEGVHFLPRADPYLLGLRAMAVNLSDIAAMGGFPSEAYVSLALSGETPVEWIEGLYTGFAAGAEKWGFAVLGGDTSSITGPIVISIAMIGFARTGLIKTRNSALPGDAIFVTGCLGDSAAGLGLLQAGSTAETAGSKEETAGACKKTTLPRKKILTGQYHNTHGPVPPVLHPDAHATLVRRHLAPVPHLAEGQWLAARSEVGAMMDSSDGIASDLLRILEQSDRRRAAADADHGVCLSAEIDLAALPVSPELASYCAATDADLQALATAGGEDYCLLGTVRPQAWDSVSAGFEARFGRPLYRIGTITEVRCRDCGEVCGTKPDGGKEMAGMPASHCHIAYFLGNVRVGPPGAGWDHFG